MSLFKGETPIGVVLVGEGASIETTTKQIAIQTTQPTDPNIDLWINPDEISQGASGLIQNQYSESETKIGTWIDGKPLYRKVINVGSINGTNVKTLSLPSDVDILLPYEGMLFDSDNNVYPLNYFNIYNAGQNIGSFYYKSRGLQIKCDADFGIINGYVIIKYTKTTD